MTDTNPPIGSPSTCRECGTAIRTGYGRVSIIWVHEDMAYIDHPAVPIDHAEPVKEYRIYTDRGHMLIAAASWEEAKDKAESDGYVVYEPYHDDPPCREKLDADGNCPKCRVYPDTQSKSLGLRVKPSPADARTVEELVKTIRLSIGDGKNIRYSGCSCNEWFAHWVLTDKQKTEAKAALDELASRLGVRK